MKNNAGKTNISAKMRKKAQISIEFIAGFTLFITVISYIIYASLAVFPKYLEQYNENSIREETWTLSIRALNYLQNGTIISNHTVNSLSGCKIYHAFDDLTTIDDNLARDNYTYFKNLFDVDQSNDFRITAKSSPVIVTDILSTSGGNNTGNITIESTDYTFEPIFNTVDNKYDTVIIRDKIGIVANAKEEDPVTLGGIMFSVDKINSAGRFVILGLKMIDCGKYIPMTAINSKVRRFATYNNWITTVDITYW